MRAKEREGGRLKPGLTPVKLLTLCVCLIRVTTWVCMRVCVWLWRAGLLAALGYKSMRQAAAFTSKASADMWRQHATGEVSINGKRRVQPQVTRGHDRQRCTSHAALKYHAVKSSLSCLLSLCAFFLLSSLLLWLHSIALCCSALGDSHTAGVFVGVSPRDDLMWAVREHPIVSI